MAIASLTRFTVPLSSDQSATTQGLLMPKLSYRYRVELINFGVSSTTTELSKQVMTFKRPTVTFDDILIDVYNSRVKLAGKPSWSETSLQVRDDATGQVQKLVGQQLQKQFDFYEQASAVAGIDYKFTARCEILDGGNGAFEPVVLETWELYGCYIKSADYGQLDYKTNDPATITMSILFDNAIQTPATRDNGVGENVGRTCGPTTN
jgi:hypothetical protein